MKRVVLIVVLCLLVMAVVVPAVSAAPPASGGYWYQVRYGDTLYGISRYTGVSVQSIVNANGISYPNWVYAGTSLWIPGGWDGGWDGGWNGGWDGGHHGGWHDNGGWQGDGCGWQNCGGGQYYTVRRGDTLFGISRYYGVSAWSIAQANGISNMNCIYAGQVLRIP